MPEHRLTHDHIEQIRRRLDLLLKDEERYIERYGIVDWTKEANRICTMLRGLGIRNDRERIPKALKALRGRGRIRVYPTKTVK